MQKRMYRDYGMLFEDWICHTLPKHLNVSASKEQAIRIKFGGFADYVRHISNKDTEAFGVFYDVLVKKFSEISKYKAPVGQKAMRGYGILRK